MKHSTKRFRKERAVGPRGFSRWVQPNMKKYLFACCDCGLVHEMKFRIVANKDETRQAVQFRVRRAERYTSAMRRANPHPCVPKSDQ